MSETIYVGVKYLSSAKGKMYDYQATEGIVQGDIVVVPTQFGVSLAQVMVVRNTSQLRTSLKVLHVISDSTPMFKEMRDNVQRQEIHKQIKSRMAEVIESAQYDEYAKVDPVIRGLVDNLKSMDS